MTINLYDGDTFDLIKSDVDLRECFPDFQDDPEYHTAIRQLQDTGRYWLGGGAAPLFYLTAHRIAA